MSSLILLSCTTPVGPFHMYVDTEGCVRASGFGTATALATRLPAAYTDISSKRQSNHAYLDAIKAYFQGDLTALSSIKHHQDGSPFQLAAWRALEALPSGKVLSYTQLAQAAGYPGAVRAAGTTCGRNRLALLVPCHRIIKSDGSLGSYLYGAPIKQWLLRHEGVAI